MLTRISSILGAAAVGGIVLATAYAAPAAAPAPAHHAPASQAHLATHLTAMKHYRFIPPVPHKYRADGLRMGLHCETATMSMP
jgi:hypothetical protein